MRNKERSNKERKVNEINKKMNNYDHLSVYLFECCSGQN